MRSMRRRTRRNLPPACRERKTYSAIGEEKQKMASISCVSRNSSMRRCSARVVKVPHGDRAAGEQGAQADALPAAVDARGEHARASTLELRDEGQVRRVVDRGAEEHLMPLRQMLEHVERADLVALVRRIRQTMSQQQNAHESCLGAEPNRFGSRPTRYPASIRLLMRNPSAQAVDDAEQRTQRWLPDEVQTLQGSAHAAKSRL